MKNKILSKIFSLITVFGLAICLTSSISSVAIAADNEDYKAKPDEYYSYVQKFTDIASVNNAFNAYYLQNELGSGKPESVATSASATDSHWCIEGGVLKRINDVKPSETTGSYETNQLAVLTFTKEAYLNFELSIDYKRGPNGFWPVIAIRQLEEGKYYLDDGAVYLNSENLPFNKLPGICDLPENTVICLKSKTAFQTSFGSKNSDEYFKRSEESLRALFSYGR